MPQSRPALRSPLAIAAFAAFALAGVGCSSVGSSAVRTGPLNLPARSGPVAIYTTSPPPGGRDLGFVEVHAVGEDGVIENLLPTFARRVAELGGNAALIERVSARFQIVNYWQTGMYSYNCWPSRYRCYGTGAYPASHEAMVVTMTGRALTASNQPVVSNAPPPPPPAPTPPPAPAAPPPAPAQEGETP